jgi:aspartate-semialdehyde dehydrogenase
LAETIALVGGDTLLGREVQDVLSESALGSQLRVVAAEEEETGKLTEIGGEPAFLAKLEADAVEDAAVVILAGTRKSSREALNTKPSGLIVDLTYETEEDPEASVRAPLAEGPDYDTELSGPQVVAHPAATAIALVMERLHRTYPTVSSIIHIFEPASERGKPGIDELQQQTVNLLSFQPLPKKIFDAQLSFNMLAQLGEEADEPLHAIEERIERHLATLLDRGDGVPMPSLRLIQSPVFHGYSFSLWIEFEEAPPPADIEGAVMGESIDVRGSDLEPPNNVGAAGQRGIAIGAITPDRNNGNAVWMWMVADNLRLSAENAAILAQGVF